MTELKSAPVEEVFTIPISELVKFIEKLKKKKQ